MLSERYVWVSIEDNKNDGNVQTYADPSPSMMFFCVAIYNRQRLFYYTQL